jgi:DNA-binding transcriptional MerR regulator
VSSGQLPAKLYFRIGEVAQLVGVEPHVLRYWETEFRSIRPGKSSKGQRVYSKRDVDKLHTIKTLLYDHRYTIAGAKRKLRGDGVEPIDESDPSLKEIRGLRESLLEIRGEIARLLDDMDES